MSQRRVSKGGSVRTHGSGKPLRNGHGMQGAAVELRALLPSLTAEVTGTKPCVRCGRATAGLDETLCVRCQK